MGGELSIDGLISGFNTTQIVDAIMAAERRPIALLQDRQEQANAELAAIRALNTQLLALQSAAQALTRPLAFQGKTVSVSDTDILSATAGSSAATGTYRLTVNSLARAHQLASQGFADTDTTTVGTGEIQVQVGDGDTTTIEITTANNTLAGVRDAINAADAGVTATIINDGSEAYPYRLVLTADDTGAESTITITSTLSGGTAPVFDSNSISAVVADDGNTYSGTATSSGTYTGTTNRSYLIQIVQGGAIGEATYRISEDGGQTWGSTQTLAATIDVYDDFHGSDLGVDVSFTSGTFGAGDTFYVDAYVPTLQEASDAEIVVGSGSGQIVVTSASNTVENVVPGVTLNLLKADSDSPVEITVANDTSTIRTNIETFVNRYNDVVSFIRQQTRYDAETETAGVLLGNSAVLKVQEDLRSALFGTVPGLDGTYDGLYSVGISVSATGTLSIDSDQLDEALSENLDAVARLFQASGESTQSGITFLTASSDTRPSAAGYRVVVTQAATKATLTGTSITDPAVSGLTIDGTNDRVEFVINGVSTGPLTLTHKTYTSGTELANEIAAKIAASESSVSPVEVVFVDEGATGYLEVRSVAYGSSQTLRVGDATSSGARDALGLEDPTATDGQDVAGTIDGYEAEGSGQILRATNENSPAQGLQLQVTLDTDEIGDGVSALVTVVKGVAKQAQDLLGYLTDPAAGYLKNREDRYTARVESYQDQIDRWEEILAVRRQRLLERFIRMEQALAALRNQGAFVTAQFQSLLNFSNAVGSNSGSQS